VNDKTAAKLARLGIATAWDALWNLPRDYEERLPLQPVRTLRPGTVATVDVRTIAVGRPFRARSGVRIFEAHFEDETGRVCGVWYNFQPRLTPGRDVRLVGPVEIWRGKPALKVPEISHAVPGEAAVSEGGGKRILPVYPLTEGLGKRTLRRLIERVVEDAAPQVPDWIPTPVLGPGRLPSLSESLRYVHFPPPDADLRALRDGRTAWHRRLAFEELFFLELFLVLRRRDVAREAAVPCSGGGPGETRLRQALPFRLTEAQTRVLREIGDDLARPHPMHRLLQGDVGSGKTVVALLACVRAVDAGLQAALMVPTEILAEQHYRTMSPLLEGAGVSADLLTAGTPRRDRARGLRGAAEGRTSLLIGTHALLEEAVRFRRLGLVVVDEQHRFGVEHRLRLGMKGAGADRPHMLVMTATPIPRSLALTVFGDLDLSVIDALPPGRERIETRHFTERDRARVYGIIREEIAQGRQAFVVYPLVSESEKLDLRDASRMAAALGEEFPDLHIGLIHGQMKSAEKEAAMSAFLRRKIQVLVSTTVIEVGIDVPNATLMVVEHAERFGLSQLHQLRGRVGRGEGRSSCLLLTPKLDPRSEAMRRMTVMVNHQDGFKIAEEDLAVRGPGEFLGKRQHGIPDFRTANLLSQTRLISQARQAAQAIVAADPDLAAPENLGLRERLHFFPEGPLLERPAG
jgi:ATP-dependent DNA helicase RecG